MDNITTFELIAGTASILSIILVFGGYVMKLKRTFKQKREDAEKEFKQEIDRLNATGGTVSARTDLGFFVLIELASLRENTNYYRHHRTLFLILAMFSFIGGNFIEAFFLTQSKLIARGSILFSLLMLILFLVLHTLVMRSENYTKKYEHRMKEVWQRAIDKRTSPKGE